MLKVLQVGPLHANVAAAEAELERIERELRAAQEKITNLSKTIKDLDVTLRDVRVEEAMERQPKRSVADLMADLAVLGEELENGRARVTGVDRMKSEATSHLAAVKKELQDGELALFVEKATAAREAMEAAARALAAAQRMVIALARFVYNRPGLRDKGAELLPLHLIWAELSNGHGLSRQWPAMGDRRVGDDMLVEETSEIKQALEEL